MKKSLLVMVLCSLLSFMAMGAEPGGGDAATPAANGALVNSSLPRSNPDETPSADTDAVVAGNTQFAIDLYGYLRTTSALSRKNLFFSPYSISVAMAMLNVGAKGATSSQIAKRMYFTLPTATLYPAINALDQTLIDARMADPDETSPELHIANSMWGQAALKFNQPFLDTLAQNFGAGIHTSNFKGDPEGSRTAINNWVAGKTNNKIVNLMPAGSVDRSTRLVLVNAIYFLAHWSRHFNPTLTEPGTFHGLRGNTKEQMMNNEGRFSYASGAGWQAVELPYFGHLNFLVIMPGKLSRFESSMTAAKLRSINDALGSAQVILTMPRFTIPGQTFSLKDALKALGVTAPFNPSAADLSGITSDEKLFVSDVLHQAYLSVDENGTEAAATTAVAHMKFASRGSKPKIVTMTIDHPFIFVIRDANSGSILFMGRYVGS